VWFKDCSKASRRRRAFLGERNKCTVSMRLESSSADQRHILTTSALNDNHRVVVYYVI